MTEDTPTTRQLGEAVEDACGESWAWYCRLHFPGKSREEVWLEDLRDLTCVVKMKQRHKVEVTVHVTGLKANRREAYYWSYQHVGKGRLQLLGSSG